LVERKTSRAEPQTSPALNAVEFRILLVLLSAPSHAYRIVKEIEAREPGVTVYPANLYRRIRDLVDRGWIEELPERAREAAGRRRVQLRVTEAGRRVAKAEAKRLQALVLAAQDARLLERTR
jgi:DNA-binding PadR family transcriptional regulator